MERKKIKLFNPNFICSAADETLRGKPVFFGDSLDVIRDCVENDKGSSFVTGFDYDADRKFCGFKVEASPYTWEFVYYDPLYEAKLAYKQGKQLQKRWNDSSPWEDISDPLWLDSIEYRIKPEETWRPYKDLDEFITDVEERFPNAKHRPAGTMPLIWVTPKIDVGATMLITGYDPREDKNPVRVNGNWLAFDYMYSAFNFSDGTPFGKKE